MNCNCWNSIAVMFELRCSKLEFGCSESASQPQDQWVGGSKSSVIALDAGVDLNPPTFGLWGQCDPPPQPTPTEHLRQNARKCGG